MDVYNTSSVTALFMSKQNIKLPLKYFPIQCFTHYAV